MLWRFLVLCAMFLANSGCDGAAGTGLASVRGTVTYEDQPVRSGTVLFVAADGPSFSTELRSDGSYEMSTDKPGGGAAPGRYKVVVIAMQGQANTLSEDRNLLPAPSELQFDGSFEPSVDKSGDGHFLGNVKGTQDQAALSPEDPLQLPPPVVPIKYTSLATTDLTATVEKKENVLNFNLTGPLK